MNTHVKYTLPSFPHMPLNDPAAAYKAALESPEVQALRKDAERYKELRTQQKFSVINWIGDDLSNDELDEAVDRVLASRANAALA